MKCESTSKQMLMSCFSETSLNDLKLSGGASVLCIQGPFQQCYVTFPLYAWLLFSLCLQIKVTGAAVTTVPHRRALLPCLFQTPSQSAEKLLSHSSVFSLRWSECAVHTDLSVTHSACLHFVILFSQIQWLFCFVRGFLMICFPQVFSVKILSLVNAEINYY